MADIVGEYAPEPMELYIRIVDGQPFEHPIMGDNFRQAFPDVDTNNLPAGFARFERLECNVVPGIFEHARVRYEWVGNVVKDVWFIEPMTPEEKEAILLEAFRRPHPEGWVFDDIIAQWVPRLQMPGSVPDVIA